MEEPIWGLILIFNKGQGDFLSYPCGIHQFSSIKNLRVGLLLSILNHIRGI